MGWQQPELDETLSFLDQEEGITLETLCANHTEYTCDGVAEMVLELVAQGYAELHYDDEGTILIYAAKPQKSDIPLLDRIRRALPVGVDALATMSTDEMREALANALAEFKPPQNRG